MRAAPLIATCLALFACGGAHKAGEQPESGPQAVRLRHEILFAQGNDEQVFEGYMVKLREAFVVKAFAGPGVSLFTVTRDGAEGSAVLHIPALSDRIDMKLVGDDIARAYLEGCEPFHGPGERECRFFGEPLAEVRDGDDRLVERRFPAAHGVGMTIRYEGYRAWLDRVEPSTITLRWGQGTNRIVIRLVDVEYLKAVDPEIFKTPRGE